MHVSGVRDRRPPASQTSRRAPAPANAIARVLVRVRQVVMRREVSWHERERLFVVGHRRGDAALSAIRRIRRLGNAAQQQKLDVLWERRDRVIERLAVRTEACCITGRLLGSPTAARATSTCRRS